MATELRFIVSTTASSLHAAEAMLAGATLVDPRTAEALAEDVAGLRVELDALALEAPEFFRHAIGQSVRFHVPLELAKVVVAKMHGPGHLTAPPSALARRIAALESAFSRAHPQALEELELRADPLRQQWEARGPGLLASVARQTESELIVEQADVILVRPALGGAGAAHTLYNSVRIEALLANPIAELPEVVRLAWLVAQLNLDLPKYQGNLHRDVAIDVGRLAMVAPVLAAAQDVELSRFGEQGLAMALAAWTGSDAGARQLAEWWETYQETNPNWAVAVGALAQMLVSQRGEARL